MDLKEKVKESILKALPNVGGTAEDIATHLVDVLGLSTTDHLRLVKEEDIVHHLPIFDCRTLLENWKKSNQEAEDHERRIEQPPQQARRQPLLTVTNQRQERDWDFSVDWADLYKIDPTLKARLTQGKKLKRKQRRELIARTVNQVRHKVTGAKRGIFLKVMKDMKKKYPLTFSGELAGGKIGKRTLTAKMQSKFDETKRPKRRTQAEVEAPAIKAAYGCIKWRAAAPEDETTHTLQQKQEALKEHYEQRRPQRWDWEWINQNMAVTYGEQRKDINQQAEEIEREKKKLANRRRRRGKNTEDNNDEDPPASLVLTTDQIRDKWPFLFTPQGMMKHFQQLTGKDLTGRLDEYFIADENAESEGQKILEFLLETNKSTKSSKKIKKRMKREEDNLPLHDAQLTGLLQLLLKRFNEDEAAIWHVIDPLAKEDDVPLLCTVPRTPGLVIAGENAFKRTTIYYCMDGHVVGVAESFKSAIGLLFAAYYVFNLNYNATAQITLEYIQRCIALINDAQGNKRPLKEAGGHYSAKKVHPALSQLDSLYEEFFAEKDRSSSSTGSSIDNDL